MKEKLMTLLNDYYGLSQDDDYKREIIDFIMSNREDIEIIMEDYHEIDD